jgi:hypothetical protein
MQITRCLAVALAAGLFLSGCGTPSVDPSPSASAADEPMFASDEEALAAAEEAFRAYLWANDMVFIDGGAEPERLAPFVTEDWLTKEVSVMNDVSRAGHRQVGNSRFDSAQLQQTIRDGEIVTIVVNLCLDVSEVSILDSADNIVGAAEPRIALEAIFRSQDAQSNLRLSGLEPWPTTDYC